MQATLNVSRNFPLAPGYSSSDNLFLEVSRLRNEVYSLLSDVDVDIFRGNFNYDNQGNARAEFSIELTFNVEVSQELILALESQFNS